MAGLGLGWIDWECEAHWGWRLICGAAFGDIFKIFCGICHFPSSGLDEQMLSCILGPMMRLWALARGRWKYL